MERTPRLSATLVHVFSQHANWVDRRQLQTLAWRMVGVMQASRVSLPAWAPDVHRRATQAQSRVRRVERWRQHQRLEVHQVDGPLLPNALAEWGTNALQLALDTSTWWERSGLVRMALIDRGRAMPLVGKVRPQPRRRVAEAVQAAVVDTAAARLPHQGRVIFVADRGFADTQRMGHLRRFAGQWRMRWKRRFWSYRGGPRPCQAHRLAWAWGEARCWPHVSLPKFQDGPVPLA